MTSIPVASTLPTSLSAVEKAPREAVSVTLDFFVPIINRSHLGGTPNDVFNQTSEYIDGAYVPCTPEKCGILPNEVYRSTPIMNEDGTPVLRHVRKRIDEAPASVAGSGALWGLVGGATLGTLGVLAGSVTGNPVVGALVGALTGGALAAAAGAVYAHGDRVRLVWDVHPLVESRYVGYREEVTPRIENGERGFLHHFVPVIEQVDHGEFKTPRVEHYRA